MNANTFLIQGFFLKENKNKNKRKQCHFKEYGLFFSIISRYLNILCQIKGYKFLESQYFARPTYNFYPQIYSEF